MPTISSIVLFGRDAKGPRRLSGAMTFKVICGGSLRRTEEAKLDMVDFGRNPKARQFGRYGMLNVRYGKAKGAGHHGVGTCCR